MKDDRELVGCLEVRLKGADPHGKFGRAATSCGESSFGQNSPFSSISMEMKSSILEEMHSSGENAFLQGTMAVF